MNKYLQVAYSPPYSLPMDISSRLDEAMREAGLESQMALARASGVPQPTINRILKLATKKGPEAATVRRLAAACNVNFDWLNEGIGPKRRGEASQAVAANEPSAIPENYIDAAELSELIALYARSTSLGRDLIFGAAVDAEKIAIVRRKAGN